MFVIDDAKLPPPTPATAATTMNVVYDVPGCAMKYSVSAVGIGKDERGEDRPVAAAELRGGERVRQPQDCSDECRHRNEEELARGIDVIDVLRHEQHHHRPDRPHREADVLGEDGPDQVAAGDLCAAVVPCLDVFGVPVIDVVVARAHQHVITVGNCCCGNAACDVLIATSCSH